jgi:D-ribose pyranase
MKKGKLLNSYISTIISEMGHTDMIVIADAGLPIPEGVERIDLAVTAGVPDFITVLETVLDELHVEKVTIAEEIKTKNSAVYMDILGVLSNESVTKEYVPHELFKELTENSKAIIRTGECSPYANIILHSGVVF